MATVSSHHRRRLCVKCTSNDSVKEFSIFVTEETDVQLLQEYLLKRKFIEGILYFKGRCINNSLTITVKNGDTLYINNVVEKRGILHKVKLLISKEERIIHVPSEISTRLLKFIIQCETFVNIEYQVLRKHNGIVPDGSTLRVPGDFENLWVEDTLKSFDTIYRPFITRRYDKDKMEAIIGMLGIWG